MVTAGVYLGARLSFLLVWSAEALTVVAAAGALTALLGAVFAVFQHDIKKVLAYSTISQLGFMFLAVGVGAYWVGVFHLVTHACFKACLFLGSGSVIHGMHFLEHKKHHAHDTGGADQHGHEHDVHGVAAHEHAEKRDLRLGPDPFDPQDMRNMGGLRSLMPATHWTYLIACVTISGFFPLAAFFSKDEILFKAFFNNSTLNLGPLIWLVGIVAAGGTAFYMFRSYFMTFWYREPTAEMKAHVHESPRSMTLVLWALAIASIFIGALLGFPHYALLEHWLEPVFAVARVGFKETPLSVELGFSLFSIVVAGAGTYTAYYFYKDAARAEARKAAAAESFLHRMLWNKYWVDELYEATVLRGTLLLSRGLAWFDLHIIDFLVNGTAKLGDRKSVV